MPKTRAKLDDLLSRLLEREALLALGAFALTLCEALGWLILPEGTGAAMWGGTGVFAAARAWAKRGSV